jgi:hypothetical protein
MDHLHGVATQAPRQARSGVEAVIRAPSARGIADRATAARSVVD